MTPPFKRTTCDCAECVECCRRPAHLIPSDVTRLRERFGAASFTRLFTRGKGALVGRLDEAGRLITTRIPTITPRVGADGFCVFHREGRCTIHEISPFGCAYFDMHMPHVIGNARSLWGVREIIDSHEYTATLDALDDTQGAR